MGFSAKLVIIGHIDSGCSKYVVFEHIVCI